VKTLVTPRDLAPFFGEQPNALLADIDAASGPADLRDISLRARAFALAHFGGASSTDWLARFIHLVDRAIVTRLIRQTERDPSGCWCLVGAAGRGEVFARQAPQLLVLLERDDQIDLARQTFSRVTDALDECGYLPGPSSGVDPDALVAPVPMWRERYRQWIQDPVRQQTYRARALFDLRPVTERQTLWEAIEAEVLSMVTRDFVRVLANDCLATLPPLTFFKDAVVEQDGEHVSTFRLEQVALQPLVDVGRVLGIATGACLGRSTLERFAAARSRMPEHEAIFREASDTLRILLWQQGRAGISQATTGAELPPSTLSSYDRRVLKGGFRSILRLIEFMDDSAWLDRL